MTEVKLFFTNCILRLKVVYGLDKMYFDEFSFSWKNAMNID